MTSASVIVHPFIVKMKIPFFVISGFILAVQLIKTIVRSATLFAGFNLIIGKPSSNCIGSNYTLLSCVLSGIVLIHRYILHYYWHQIVETNAQEQVTRSYNRQINKGNLLTSKIYRS
jgi:hypothetical protein